MTNLFSNIPGVFCPRSAGPSLLGLCGSHPLRRTPSACQEASPLFRHKVSVKQRWLSLVQEYFWCRQIGSTLRDFPCLCLSQQNFTVKVAVETWFERNPQTRMTLARAELPKLWRASEVTRWLFSPVTSRRVWERCPTTAQHAQESSLPYVQELGSNQWKENCVLVWVGGSASRESPNVLPCCYPTF